MLLRFELDPIRRFCFLLLLSFLIWSPASHAEDVGEFLGNPQAEWDPDGRTMLLLQDFIYVDPAGKEWVAPAGSKVDGASIPQMFWWLIGGPFEGRYRNASVVHDTECQEPYKHHWQDVHRMFYWASRAGGVRKVKAKVMFAAVYHFGPRWPWQDEDAPPPSRVKSKDDALRMWILIRRNEDISLQAIEGLTHEALVAQVSDQDLEFARERLEENRRRRAEGHPHDLLFF